MERTRNRPLRVVFEERKDNRDKRTTTELDGIGTIRREDVS
jgi:hypothetical protein